MKCEKILPTAAAMALSLGLIGQANAQIVVSLKPIESRPAPTAEKAAKNAGLDGLKAEYKRPKFIPFPKENPYTRAKAELGKILFFDPRLSRSNMQSCASCHNPSFGWGDGLAKGVGDRMNPLGRRTPTILNAAWMEIFMWDGRKETIEDQALGPIEADVEMNMPLDKLVEKLAAIPGYVKLFAEAFPKSPKISADNIAKAIATFERTVVSNWAPFDRWINGDEKAISDQAKRGFVVFNEKGRCATCHASWRFTDDSFHDVGLPDKDIGRGKFLPEIEKMQHAFKTPGLRNLDQRAPFMHDGSLADLAAVVAHYNDGGVKRKSRADDVLPLGLSKAEQADLVAFLETLTSNDQPVPLPTLPR